MSGSQNAFSNPPSSRPAVRSSWMIWVDGVGGYLVCPGPSAWIGRAVFEPRVEIPLVGNLQRRHARLVWQSERHVMAPASPIWVNGHQVSEPVQLKNGDVIRLADSVAVRYRQPLLLGSTACLDLVRPARTVPWCDGILLMGETLILGQSPAGHIVCHELSKGLVLVNRQGDLTVQTSRWIDVDGRRVRGSVRIGLGSRLVCDDVSVTFEAHQ